MSTPDWVKIPEKLINYYKGYEGDRYISIEEFEEELDANSHLIEEHLFNFETELLYVTRVWDFDRILLVRRKIKEALDNKF